MPSGSLTAVGFGKVQESVSLSGTAGGETGGEREGFPSVLVKAAAWWPRGLAGGTGLAGDESRRTEAAQPRSEAGAATQLDPAGAPQTTLNLPKRPGHRPCSKPCWGEESQKTLNLPGHRSCWFLENLPGD